MHKLQPGKTLTRRFYRTGLIVAAAIAALASTAALAANCNVNANINPANLNVNENALVTLDGSNSQPRTGASYSWIQLPGGPSVTLSGANTATPMFTAPAVGPAGATLKFRLTVTACSPPETSTKDTTVTVIDTNKPPVAKTTVSPESIYTGYTVTLNGSNSSDPDGDALTYLWEQMSGTAVTLTGANTAMATFTAPNAPFPDGTTLKFRLTVSDGSLQDSKQQIVNVLWQNAAPTARVSCPASVDEGQPFTLSGSTSSDPDNGIAAYSWSQTLGGPVAILPLNLTTASITAEAPLLDSNLVTMKFMLVVTDVGGLQNSAECSVDVNDITPPNAKPTQSPAANGNGWNNTDVTVTWHWLDYGLGIDEANCTETSTSSGEGEPLHLSATCKDLRAPANLGSAGYDVKVDKTKPTISASEASSPNIYLWYKDDATVHFTCADALSGLAGACPADELLTGEGMAVKSTAWTVTDLAGNVSVPANRVTVSIDRTKPTITAAATTPPNGNHWYKDDVTVDFTCTDALSGFADGCPGNQVLSAEGTDVSSTPQTATDKAGNESVLSNVVTVSIDKTAPTISAALSPPSPNGNNSWYKSNVTVDFTCSDGLSGVDGACPDDELLSDEGTAVKSHSQTVTDLAGNVSEPSGVFTVKIDKTAPTISVALSPPSPNGDSDWYTSNVTVKFTCADPISGLAGECPDDELLSSEGDAVESTKQTVSDMAGNVSDASEAFTVKIDKTKPKITAAATTSPNGNDWYKGNVTVDFTCTDKVPGSGIGAGACPDDELLSIEGAAVDSHEQTVSDIAGNVSDPSNVVTVKIDKTKPTISAAATTSPNGNGWYMSDVTVHFTCTDGLSGIAFGGCPGNQVLSTEGAAVASIAKTVSDNADNESASSNVVTVKIDKTKPTISVALSPPLPNGNNNWYTSNVTVDFTCADSLSGIVTGGCPGNQVLSTEGAAVSSIAKTVSDNAGNVSDSSEVKTVKIDKTAPGVNWTGGILDGDSFYFGSVPAAPTCAASDALSGPANCAVTGYSGSVGTHTLTATAHDMAGNQTEVKRSYTVNPWTLGGFYQPVDMNNVVNTVKGGSTVPLKFEVFAANELTDVGVVKSFMQQRVTCAGAALEDAIEVVSTGGTSLRYDSTAGQFIQNWQTPKQPGACYTVTMTTDDGSSRLANFKLK